MWFYIRRCRLMHWEGSLWPREFLNIRIKLRSVFSFFKENNCNPCWKHRTGYRYYWQSWTTSQEIKKCGISSDVPWLLFHFEKQPQKEVIQELEFSVHSLKWVATVSQQFLYVKQACIILHSGRKGLVLQQDTAHISDILDNF